MPLVLSAHFGLHRRIAMSLNPILRDELTEILLEALGENRSEVIFTGEAFSADALAVARAYERATGQQQAAVRAVIKLWEELP
jgi:hypothetical protein